MMRTIGLICLRLLLLFVHSSDTDHITDSSCTNQTNSCLWIVIRQLVKLETSFNEFETKLNKIDSRIIKLEQQSIHIDHQRLGETHRKMTDVDNKTQVQLATLKANCDATQSDFIKFQNVYSSRNENLTRQMETIQRELELCQCKAKHETPVCTNGWKLYGTHCYYFAVDLKSWQDAVDACKKTNGYLVKIDSSAENTWLKSMVKDDTWIGANDLQIDGQWRWVSDKTLVSFSDWYPGQPSNENKGEHCASLWRDILFQWNDHYCDTEKKYICELVLYK